MLLFFPFSWRGIPSYFRSRGEKRLILARFAIAVREIFFVSLVQSQDPNSNPRKKRQWLGFGPQICVIWYTFGIHLVYIWRPVKRMPIRMSRGQAVRDAAPPGEMKRDKGKMSPSSSFCKGSILWAVFVRRSLLRRSLRSLARLTCTKGRRTLAGSGRNEKDSFC